MGEIDLTLFKDKLGDWGYSIEYNSGLKYTRTGFISRDEAIKDAMGQCK